MTFCAASRHPQRRGKACRDGTERPERLFCQIQPSDCLCSWQRPPGFGKGSIFFDLDAHIISLSVATKRIMRKYSGEKFRPTHGISREIRQIMAARRFICIASGALRTLISPVANAVPASILQNHPNCAVPDRAASAKLCSCTLASPKELETALKLIGRFAENRTALLCLNGNEALAAAWAVRLGTEHPAGGR